MKRKATLEDYGFKILKHPKIACEISDLPNEMLREIFKHLPMKDRLNARIVSNFWMELMNKYFQEDNTIVVTHVLDFSPKGSLYQTFKTRLSSTKAKRQFSRLAMSWLPDKKIVDFIEFIKLIGDEIRFLNISYLSSTKFINDLYANLPNLESLEVYNEEYLGDFTFSPKLKVIKIGYQFTQLDKLPDIQKLNLEHFSTKCLGIEKITNALASFFDPKLKTLLDAMLAKNDPETDSIGLHAEFNFCGETKLTADDVTKVKIDQQMINIAPLIEFINLKELELHLNYEHAFADFVSFYECIKFTSVTALEIYGPYGSTVTLTHADKFFRKFPNLESLFVDEWVLTNEDFLAICQFMPKLKYLFIESSKISVETLFDLDNFSLKDLKSLESLSIKTKFENLYFFQPSWPSLPNLKVVYLKGEGFHYLEKDFFTQMAEKSPKIENLEIFYAYDSEEYNHSKFLPILSRLNLKDLILPGEGGSATSTQNTKLVDSVIKHCKNLTFFGIHDVNGFSLAQEIQLFKNLPKLKIINSDSMDDNRYFCRDMERKDFVDLKEYLAKYLYKYKDMTGTIAYLYNHQIPLPERIQIEKDFDTKYDEDDLKIWYTVLRGYLNMNDLDFCRTLKFHVH